jgi:hypothetical protein
MKSKLTVVLLIACVLFASGCAIRSSSGNGSVAVRKECSFEVFFEDKALMITCEDGYERYIRIGDKGVNIDIFDAMHPDYVKMIVEEDITAIFDIGTDEAWELLERLEAIQLVIAKEQYEKESGNFEPPEEDESDGQIGPSVPADMRFI